VVARLVETHSNVSSPPVDHYNICEDDVERSMKKTCTDREPVAAPPFMSGDVMIRVLHSESNQAATSVQKTMRVCVLAVSSERSTKNSVYCVCPTVRRRARQRPVGHDSEARIT